MRQAANVMRREVERELTRQIGHATSPPDEESANHEAGYYRDRDTRAAKREGRSIKTGGEIPNNRQE